MPARLMTTRMKTQPLEASQRIRRRRRRDASQRQPFFSKVVSDRLFISIFKSCLEAPNSTLTLSNQSNTLKNAFTLILYTFINPLTFNLYAFIDFS